MEQKRKEDKEAPLSAKHTTSLPRFSKKNILLSFGLLLILVIGFINPFERLAIARDNERMAGVESLINALDEYYLKTDGLYPSSNTPNWMSALTKEGVLKKIPSKIDGWRFFPCKSHEQIVEQNNYCYVVDDLFSPTLSMVYVKLESSFYYAKCKEYGTSYYPYYLYSSLQGLPGVSCQKEDPQDMFVDFLFEK